ncbi:hypothetical protein TWF730_006048 [Orbilia blumenaviensis]|uniref:EH domain-containing protein n=1 Tax=Orbilia blumenaviensis TaxID=1796055 RepID=A0AAV9VMD7_9PEZI
MKLQFSGLTFTSIVMPFLAKTGYANVPEISTKNDDIFSKIGTLDQYSETYYSTIKAEYRKDEKFKNNAIRWAESIAAAPRERNVYTTESETLGFLAISITVDPKQRSATRERVPLAVNQGFGFYRRIFSDDLYPALFKYRPPQWLQVKPAAPDNPQKPLGIKGRVGKWGQEPTAKVFERNARILSKTPIESKAVNDIFLDMKTISQPPRTSHQDLQGRFWNYKRPGNGQVVYVIDTGCDLDHPEVADIKFRKDWIDGGAGFPSGEVTDFNDALNVKHGTAVVGRVAGKHTGVAHDAEVVVVKMINSRGVITLETIMNSFVKVYDDIVKNPERNCIVNFSAGWFTAAEYGWDGTINDQTAFDKAFNTLALYIFMAFADLPNAIILVSAGNESPVSAQLW